ncbi:MAG: thermonuclease family protein [Candidatus Pacearchaeota archaeon]
MRKLYKPLRLDLMMKKVSVALIIALFLTVTFFFYKNFLYDKLTTKNILEENKIVTKVIDGDTIIVSGGQTIRLLGVDTDEKGYPCYYEAKTKLEKILLDKEVYLESDKEDKDQYNRLLRYVFIDGENINIKLVKEGLAVARLNGYEKYLEEIKEAENYAIKNKVGCKWNSSYNLLTQASCSRLTGEIVSACNAKSYIGEEKIVEGKIADSYKSKTDTVFLNFENIYPYQCFTAVIFSSDLVNFPENPHEYYAGKTIRVKGKIRLYKNKPEIILKNQEQIEICN